MKQAKKIQTIIQSVLFDFFSLSAVNPFVSGDSVAVNVARTGVAAVGAAG